MKAYQLTIWGDVQGVSYRYFAKREAKALGLTGFAKNEHDGSVKIFIQGPEEKLLDFLNWVDTGSPMATVKKVNREEVETEDNIKEFEVK